ncbi:MAG TPA: hypothetical protein PKI03_29475, partial [Pseudomonadota bacterium]|nr:hypothetical protein [Pseudomonadota bacterium]
MIIFYCSNNGWFLKGTDIAHPAKAGRVRHKTTPPARALHDDISPDVAGLGGPDAQTGFFGGGRRAMLTTARLEFAPGKR